MLPALGLSVEPLTRTAHESVLTVSGTEDNNGIRVKCQAHVNTPTFRICSINSGREVSVMFHQAGMKVLRPLCV